MAGNSAGKLKIGDDWNVITIIALSQSNPLKAIAEFVENSIDAKARNVMITREKRGTVQCLRIRDDGEGINDFNYVATHIGDSLKRQLKRKGAKDIQGEYGIGLLSFWTIGEELLLTSTGSSGETKRMKMVKNNQGYSVEDAPELFKATGTELIISPLLQGIRNITGEKIQNYLASELRDRINKSHVNIRINDKVNRKDLIVEPRKFHGRLLHHLPPPHSPFGEIYLELYLNEPSRENKISIYRHGTRVIPDITRLDAFNISPWRSEYLEGIIDVPFLNLTPGTREGIIYDDTYDSFVTSMEETTGALQEIINEQKQAEDDSASKTILNRVAKALREAFFYLPQEEYIWLPVLSRKKNNTLKGKQGSGNADEYASDSEGIENEELQVTQEMVAESLISGTSSETPDKAQEMFAGPLHKVLIYPASCTINVGKTKKLRAAGKDKRGRVIDDNLKIEWKIISGSGVLSEIDGTYTQFEAPEEPGITTVEVVITQDDTQIRAESIITVTEELIASTETGSSLKRGLPGYTYKNSPGELWRSYFDQQNYVIVINKGHADFVYSSRMKARKLRYINKLFAKELVLANFPELSKEDLLERMVELSFYTEENL